MGLCYKAFNECSNRDCFFRITSNPSNDLWVFDVIKDGGDLIWIKEQEKIYDIN